MVALMNYIEAHITPSPERGRGNGPETRPEAKPRNEACSPKPPRTRGTLAL